MGQKEIIVNGAFASDTGWTKGVGWTIAAGVADCDGSQVAVSELYQAAASLRGKELVVTFTITRSAGTVTLKLGTTAGTARSAAGTYEETLVMAGGDNIIFEADVDFIGTIDNVIGYIETAETEPGTSLEAGKASGEHFLEAATEMDTTREYSLPPNPDDRYTE